MYSFRILGGEGFSLDLWRGGKEGRMGEKKRGVLTRWIGVGGLG